MAIIQQIQKPRTIIIHKSTTNQSFLDMHYYLKSKGIQNNDFFLALLDPGLAGVDPRDPRLNEIMKMKIQIKINKLNKKSSYLMNLLQHYLLICQNSKNF